MANFEKSAPGGKNILWLTWKDLKNPLAGGAEVVNQEIAKRLIKDGYKLIFIVAGFRGGKKKDSVDGYKIIRVGNRFSVYFKAYRYYKKHLQGWADLVIEEINTFPFASQFYIHPVKSPAGCGDAHHGEQFNGAKQKRILIIYQLCRQIWFYQMIFPLSLFGYLLEPLYLRLLKKNQVITISASTKSDLLKYDFKEKNIKIISPGIEINPVPDLNEVKKCSNFTLLSLGAIRKMKRPDHQLKAFEIAKEALPKLKLIIAGTGHGRYHQRIMRLIENSPHRKDIEYLGRVSREDKIKLLQKCHLILVTSVKEGWGLIVTEANSQGTPAVVYDVDGLRDSVRNNQTGLLAKKNAPRYLAKCIVELARDKNQYLRLQKAAWQWSKEINFENCYQEFLKAINEK